MRCCHFKPCKHSNSEFLFHTLSLTYVFLSNALADCFLLSFFFLPTVSNTESFTFSYLIHIHLQLGNLKHIWSVNQIHATHVHALIGLRKFQKPYNGNHFIHLCKKWALWILEKSIVYNETMSPVGWKYS